MELFELWRKEDPSGVSGIGRVAEGVIFSDGRVALRWTSLWRSTAVYDSLDDVRTIHGHDGATEIRMLGGEMH